AEGKKQLGERVFEAAAADVVTVREVNDEDSAEHDDDHADASNAEQRAGQDGEASSELGQSHEIADNDRHMHEGREALRPWAAKHPKQYCASVIKKGKSASD